MQFLLFRFWGTDWLNETRVGGAGRTKLCSAESRPFFGRLRKHCHIFYLFITYIFKLKVPFETWDKRAQLVRTDMLFCSVCCFGSQRGMAWSGFSYSISEPWRTLKRIRWGTSIGQRADSRETWARKAQLVHLKMEKKVVCAFKKLSWMQFICTCCLHDD